MALASSTPGSDAPPHAHAPHELTEGPEHERPTSRRERVLELSAVALMSITAVATEYRLASLERSKTLDGQANAHHTDGTNAKSNDDHYILSTVFFAAVLFFAGISLRLDWRRLRRGVLTFASAMLLGGLIYVFTLPIS
jgi:hypothetical protein